MIQRVLAHLRTRQGRDQLSTFAAEGLSMLGMVLAYRLAANMGKQDLDLYVVVRRTVSFIYPLLLIGAAVGLMRFVAMAADPMRQRAYLRGTLRWVAPLGLVLAAIGLIWSKPIAWVLFGPDAGVDLVAPLALMIAGISVHGVGYSYLRGKGTLTLANSVQVWALALAPCIALVVFKEMSMILWATGIAWLVVAVLAIARDLLAPSQASSKRERAELLRYGLPRLPGDMALGALLTVPVYVVARTHGLAESAELGFGTTLLNFVSAVFSPVTLLLLPASAAQLAAGDHHGLSTRIGRMVRIMLLASLGIMLAFEVSADLLLDLYLGDAGETYVFSARVVFLGALPFGFYFGLRSVLDAYYHTPRNGVNLLMSFSIFMVGALLHFIIPSPPAVVAIALVVSLYYLGWVTWRDVDFVRSELERLAHDESKGLRVVMVIPAREEQAEAFDFARQQAAQFGSVFGAHVEIFHLGSRTSLWKLVRDRQRLKRLLRKSRPDVVHVHCGSVTALFTVLSSAVPVVVNFHDNDPLHGRDLGYRRSILGKLFSQLAAFFSAGIICDKEELRERLWWRHEEARVLPVEDPACLAETHAFLRSVTFRAA